MKRWLSGLIVGTFAHLAVSPAFAQNADPADIRACTGIESDAQRLACYDRATGRNQMPAAKKRTEPTSSPSSNVFSQNRSVAAATSTGGNSAAPLSLLDSRWELSPESKLGTFNLRGYKPIYVLPAFATSNQNNLPYSPNPENAAHTPLGMQDVESKFQLSLKTKLWQGVFGDVGDLWVGYTQDSYGRSITRSYRDRSAKPITNPKPCWYSIPITKSSAGMDACSASASTINPMASPIRSPAAGIG
jgi:phospholipase A1